MSDNSNTTDITNKRYLTLIVRLLVDNKGKLQFGTLIDLNGKVVGRFRKLSETVGLISSWLKTKAPNHNSSESTKVNNH